MRETPELQGVHELLEYLGEDTRLVEAQLDVLTNLANLDDELERGQWIPIGMGRAGTLGTKTETLAYRTEAELTLIRNVGRALALKNPFAINAIQNGISYIVGTGHTYKVVKKAHVEVDDVVVHKAQEVIDDFRKKNKWPQRQEEFWERRERDGEVFRRLFKATDGILRVRFVEPDQITQPAEIPECPFGIEFRTLPNRQMDCEEPVSYYVHPLFSISQVPQPGQWEQVSPEEMIHTKANVDLSAPRGIPTFYPVESHLNRALKILRNMSTVVEIQAAIAWIRKHQKQTQDTITNLVSRQATASVTSNITGEQRTYRQYPPGSILDVPNTMDYQFPGVSVDVSRIVFALQAELRAVAARMQYPEWMLTADSSTSNYSNSMVAEGPATKKFERCQSRIIEEDTYIMERVLLFAAERDMLPDNILELVEIHAEAPRVQSRNEAQDVQVITGLAQLGLVSPQTATTRFSYDYDKEQELIKAHKEKQAAEKAAAQPQGGNDGAPGGADEFSPGGVTPPPQNEADSAGGGPTPDWLLGEFGFPPEALGGKPTEATVGRPRESLEPPATNLQEGRHTYSCVMCVLPDWLRDSILRIQSAVDVRDLSQPMGLEKQPHITIKYGLWSNDPRDPAAILYQEEPPTIALGPLSVFPFNPDKAKPGDTPADVLKLEVESEDLARLHQKFLDKMENVETWPEYKPHITIAYLKPGTAAKYAGPVDALTGVETSIQVVDFTTRDGHGYSIPLPAITLGDIAPFEATQESLEVQEAKKPPKQYKAGAPEGKGGQFAPNLAGLFGSIDVGANIPVDWQPPVLSITSAPPPKPVVSVSSPEKAAGQKEAGGAGIPTSWSAEPSVQTPPTPTVVKVRQHGVTGKRSRTKEQVQSEATAALADAKARIEIGSPEYSQLDDAGKESLLREAYARLSPADPFTRYTSVKSERYSTFTDYQKALNRELGTLEAQARGLLSRSNAEENPKVRRYLLHSGLACLHRANIAHERLTDLFSGGGKA